jgi:hypothetical protein
VVGKARYFRSRLPRLAFHLVAFVKSLQQNPRSPTALYLAQAGNVAAMAWSRDWVASYRTKQRARADAAAAAGPVWPGGGRPV